MRQGSNAARIPAPPPPSHLHRHNHHHHHHRSFIRRNPRRLERYRADFFEAKFSHSSVSIMATCVYAFLRNRSQGGKNRGRRVCAIDIKKERKKNIHAEYSSVRRVLNYEEKNMMAVPSKTIIMIIMKVFLFERINPYVLNIRLHCVTKNSRSRGRLYN